MDKWKLKWLTWGVVVFMVLAVGLMLSRTLRRTSHITLPESGPSSEQTAGAQDGERAQSAFLPDDRAAVFKGQDVVGSCQ